LNQSAIESFLCLLAANNEIVGLVSPAETTESRYVVVLVVRLDLADFVVSVANEENLGSD